MPGQGDSSLRWLEGWLLPTTCVNQNDLTVLYVVYYSILGQNESVSLGSVLLNK